MNEAKHASLGTVTATAVSAVETAVEGQYLYAVDARAVDDHHYEAPRPPPYQSPQPDENSVRQFLRFHNWPAGLQSLFLQTRQKCPIRYFICDDSGSMNAGDGKHTVGSGPATKCVPCSRWSELCDALRFHANLAHASGATTEFRLLNGAAPLLIGTGDLGARDHFLSLLDASPNGGTPLCWHVNAIAAAIAPIAGQLRAAGQRAVLTIFTDGESSDLFPFPSPYINCPPFIYDNHNHYHHHRHLNHNNDDNHNIRYLIMRVSIEEMGVEVVGELG